MAYTDFYPHLLDTTDKCIEYALAVADDVDGYEGIEFCRWLADIMGKTFRLIGIILSNTSRYILYI